MHAKAFMAGTTAAAARGELIAKDLLEKQAAFLLLLDKKILAANNLCSKDGW